MDEEKRGESVKNNDTKTTGVTLDEDERSESVTGGLQQTKRKDVTGHEKRQRGQRGNTRRRQKRWIGHGRMKKKENRLEAKATGKTLQTGLFWRHSGRNGNPSRDACVSEDLKC